MMDNTLENTGTQVETRESLSTINWEDIPTLDDRVHNHTYTSYATVNIWINRILREHYPLDRFTVAKLIKPSGSPDMYRFAYIRHPGEIGDPFILYVSNYDLTRLKAAIQERENMIKEQELEEQRRHLTSSTQTTNINTASDVPNPPTQDELYYPREEESTNEEESIEEESINTEAEATHESVTGLIDQRTLTSEEMRQILDGYEESEESNNIEGNNNIEVNNSEEIENNENNESNENNEEESNQDSQDSQSSEYQEIPINSPSTYIKEATSRFSGAEWFEAIKKKVIILAGVGGIGSWATLLLSRLNPNSIYIYDGDRVEAVNMAGQLYQQSDIGTYKVNAIAEMIRNYCDFNSVFAVNEFYTNESATGDIMICGFDNMAARAMYFKKWLSHVQREDSKYNKNCLFIDARLSAEMCQVFCIKGDDVYNQKLYAQKYLFKDSEVEDAPCSYKQTTYCACMVASLIVNLVVNFVTNQGNPIIERDLPFFTEYNASLVYLKF